MLFFSSFFRESEVVLSFGFEWAGKSCWHFYCNWKHTVWYKRGSAWRGSLFCSNVNDEPVLFFHWSWRIGETHYWQFFFRFFFTDWYSTGKLASQKAMVSVSLGMRRQLWVYGAICRVMRSMDGSSECISPRMRKEGTVSEIKTRCFCCLCCHTLFTVEDFAWILYACCEFVFTSSPRCSLGNLNLQSCLKFLSSCNTLQTLISTIIVVSSIGYISMVAISLTDEILQNFT
jgi:hypothetical protein